jgi:DNA-binding XRE family transcriptional regulator
LSPGTIFDQKLCLDSLDEVIQGCEGDEMSMHDLLASAGENPASQAARELDWADVLLDCNERDAALLACTAAGGCLGDLAARYGVSSARLCQQKREIGRQVKLRWGEDALADAVREPSWTSHMRANHERAACRHERASEARAWRPDYATSPGNPAHRRSYPGVRAQTLWGRVLCPVLREVRDDRSRLHAIQLSGGGAPLGNKEFTMPIKTIHAKAYRALITRLRERRIELGLTQRDVATKTGHSRTWLQKIESAELRLDVLQTFDLLKVLEIELEEVVDLLQKEAL